MYLPHPASAPTTLLPARLQPSCAAHHPHCPKHIGLAHSDGPIPSSVPYHIPANHHCELLRCSPHLHRPAKLTPTHTACQSQGSSTSTTLQLAPDCAGKASPVISCISPPAQQASTATAAPRASPSCTSPWCPLVGSVAAKGEEVLCPHPL